MLHRGIARKDRPIRLPSLPRDTYMARNQETELRLRAGDISQSSSSSSFTAPAKPAHRRPPIPTSAAQSSSTLGRGLKLSLLARLAFFATAAALDVAAPPYLAAPYDEVVDVEEVDIYDAERWAGCVGYAP